jgi:tetratricopeptide (TPR) repeat protein
MLGDKAEYISDPQLRAEIYFQLCESYIEKGDLNLAYKKLTEILVLAKPGPLMYEASLRLGDVCLRLGQNSQAISVCTQLLDLQPSEQIKQKTLNLLSMAYNQNKNYDKAALALLGQWK